LPVDNIAEYQYNATVKREGAMATKAVGYVRVSTVAQASEGVSLEAQRERIAAYCAANGFELVETFVDSGLSGKRADNRPGLQKALALACRVRGALIVYSLSRLARSVPDTLRISGQLEKAGADLVSLSERIDSTTAAGRMVFKMLAVLAEFERDLTSERTKLALAQKRQRGECCGEVPFGWRRAGTMLVPVPEAQRALVLIRDMRGRGASFRAIADELGARGIPTPKGGRWVARGVWSAVNRVAA
jgi:site-specific DNA recombinase